MRTVSKKYGKYAKEFKQEVDLQVKDFEQYAKLKHSISQYENKIADIQKRLDTTLASRTTLDKESRRL